MERERLASLISNNLEENKTKSPTNLLDKKKMGTAVEWPTWLCNNMCCCCWCKANFFLQLVSDTCETLRQTGKKYAICAFFAQNWRLQRQILCLTCLICNCSQTRFGEIAKKMRKCAFFSSLAHKSVDIKEKGRPLSCLVSL